MRGGASLLRGQVGLSVPAPIGRPSLRTSDGSGYLPIEPRARAGSGAAPFPARPLSVLLSPFAGNAAKGHVSGNHGRDLGGKAFEAVPEVAVLDPLAFPPSSEDVVTLSAEAHEADKGGLAIKHNPLPSPHADREPQTRSPCPIQPAAEPRYTGMPA
jgi:hypothetical protein